MSIMGLLGKCVGVSYHGTAFVSTKKTPRGRSVGSVVAGLRGLRAPDDGVGFEAEEDAGERDARAPDDGGFAAGHEGDGGEVILAGFLRRGHEQRGVLG